jgi:hypothetical protein
MGNKFCLRVHWFYTCGDVLWSRTSQRKTWFVCLSVIFHQTVLSAAVMARRWVSGSRRFEGAWSCLITSLERPTGVEEIEAPRISGQSAHEYVNVVSPAHRPPLPSRENSWYSFLLDTESTAGPYCDRKDENPSDPIGNRTARRSDV